MDYSEFLRTRTQWHSGSGFEPIDIPDWLFGFQKYLVDWSIRHGRSAILADCGMGKGPMALVWGNNVVRHTNKPVLFATPLAVGQQIMQEAERFGVDAERSRDGTISGSKRIVITNYQQLHKFDSRDFGGMVCDESSCIKDFKSATKAMVVEFMRNMDYRLLCTATAAPNDFWELGTSSEALGYIGFRDMITKFFRQETSKDHRGWGRTKYRFRGHAEEPFWSWVCSWARSVRQPSDLGFQDDRFVLPDLIQDEYVVQSSVLREGMLFSMPARDMREERQERRNSMQERCQKAADIANARDEPAVVWCELNDEGNMLEKMVDDCVQVKGAMSDEAKEEALVAFGSGEVKRIVIKPKIGAWGLNWQHCSNVVILPTHSFEQTYQAIRRCWRFGQEHPVTASFVVSEGERGILDNLRRKQLQADKMFESIVAHMGDAMKLVSTDYFPEDERVPTWL